MNTLVVSTYNRPDLLTNFLTRLSQQDLSGFMTRIVDDCSTDPRVQEALVRASRSWPGPIHITYGQENQGISQRINSVLINEFYNNNAEIAVVLDPDVEIDPTDWPQRLVKFLQEHKEVGLVVPDKPGSYLRLHRKDYDEVEWAVSLCYAVRQNVFRLAILQDSYWFDPELYSSQDPDLCYRLRLLGYRIVVMKDCQVKDLGVGQSTVSDKLARSNWHFNQKWNSRLLGRFPYKCPGGFLRWEDWPLNLLFRRLVNAQQRGIEVVATPEKLCDHEAERVSFLACKGNHPSNDTLKKFIDADIWVNEAPDFDKVDPELAEGKRQFDLEKDAGRFKL